jgi:hypothetical protein
MTIRRQDPVVRVGGLVMLLVLVFAVAGQGQRGPLTSTKFPTTIVTGVLKDTTRYTLAKPEMWNGTVFVDLDSLGMDADYSNWLYAHGIARVGTTRDQVGSLMDRAAANMVEALDIFTAKFGRPTRAIIWGNSLGGQAAAVAAFRYPDRFAAALPHCGGLMGWPAYLNTNLDVAFVLKTLVDPKADLPLVHIPDDDAALNARWKALVDGAQQTPQGRARIALAAAVGQAPVWTVASTPEPAETGKRRRTGPCSTSAVSSPGCGGGSRCRPAGQPRGTPASTTRHSSNTRIRRIDAPSTSCTGRPGCR